MDDFVKKTSILHYSRERFEREAPHVIRLADAVEHAEFLEARDLADAMGIGSRLREMTADAMKWTDAMRASIA